MDYFVYSANNGYEECHSQEEAVKQVNAELIYEREAAVFDGEWHDEVESLCWGIVLGKTVVEKQHIEEIEYADYHIQNSDAIVDVLKERQRQIEVEGWTPDHEDKHSDCQLATAAACYCVCDTESHLNEFKIFGVPVWPWSKFWWKPTTYRQNLVKAAALILAEIERIDRKEKKNDDYCNL